MTIELDTQDIQFNINPEEPAQALNQLVQMAKQQSDKIKQLNRRIRDLENIVLN